MAFLALMMGQADDAFARAVASGSPLVVGVGCAAPAGAWETVLVKSLDGYKAPCIVVCVKGRGTYMIHRATLTPGATAADVRAVLTRPSLQPKYDPETQQNFQQRMNNQRRRIGRGYPWQAAARDGAVC